MVICKKCIFVNFGQPQQAKFDLFSIFCFSQIQQTTGGSVWSNEIVKSIVDAVLWTDHELSLLRHKLSAEGLAQTTDAQSLV